jgi:hypothetical protein
VGEADGLARLLDDDVKVPTSLVCEQTLRHQRKCQNVSNLRKLLPHQCSHTAVVFRKQPVRELRLS